MPAIKSNLFGGRKVQPIVRSAARFAAIIFLISGCVSFAQTNIMEFPITRVTPVTPTGIAQDTNGAYWFTEFAQNNGALGRVDPATGLITEIALTNNPDAAAFAIVLGQDRNLWFTEHGANRVGRLNVNSNYVDFPFTNVNSNPFGITPGPDGNLWVAEFGLNKIAAFNPFSPSNSAGGLQFVHEYGPFGASTRFGSIPGTNAQIYGLTTGSDGNLWFTQTSYGAIGRLTPAGVSTVKYLANSNCQPIYIAAGSDGALWFTEFNTNKIGRIDTNMSGVTEYSIPLFPAYPNPEPYNIIAGNDGNLWFTEFGGASIGRITTSGIITLFPTPTGSSFPNFLANGRYGGDTNIWFCENISFFNVGFDDAVGRLITSETLNLSVGSVSASNTTFSGQLATFQNSNPNDTVTVTWGDGTSNVVAFSNPAPNASASVTNLVSINSTTYTNTLTVSNVVAINTNTGANGTFSILANHTFPSLTNFPFTVTVLDSSNDMAYAAGSNFFVLATSVPMMRAQRSSGGLVLTWAAKGFNLQSSTNGVAWSTINGATSPYTNSMSATETLFRLKSQ